MKMNFQEVKGNIFLLFCPILILFSSIQVSAKEFEPRAYTNVPIGFNFVHAWKSYSAGRGLFEPSVSLENANVKTHGSHIAYSRSIIFREIAKKIDMIFPFAWLSGIADFNGKPVSSEVSGLADPLLHKSVIFIGGPALSLSGIKYYKQNFVAGASVQSYLPLRQYDSDKIDNIGTNWFVFRPELGISKKNTTNYN